MTSFSLSCVICDVFLVTLIYSFTYITSIIQQFFSFYHDVFNTLEL